MCSAAPAAYLSGPTVGHCNSTTWRLECQSFREKLCNSWTQNKSTSSSDAAQAILISVSWFLNPFTPKLKKYILPTFYREMWKWCDDNLVEFGSTVIVHTKFFLLCDIILLARLQEKFELDHPWEWKGKQVKPIDSVSPTQFGREYELHFARVGGSIERVVVQSSGYGSLWSQFLLTHAPCEGIWGEETVCKSSSGLYL